MTHENAVHVVFGGTGAVGQALSRQLVVGGARVVVAGRDAERCAEVARAVGAEGESFEAREPRSIDACVGRIMERHGRIDGVAHCVGSLLLKPAHLTSDDEWREVLEVNLGSAFAVLRAGTRAMVRTGGSIVLVSSAAARIGLANHEGIAAAKAGIQGLVLAAAASYGSKGIRINAVAPGLVESKLTERIVANERALETSRGMHVLGRIGQPEDVASAIAWFLDPAQVWVTGQILGVDGGLGTVRSRG